ncbi:outer membrane beta-barrel protein [Haoranjiania flava]|uniref:Outer membrane beta-barrel protein n=1 Tax=Haoranjiania flava TaxID=1856322 RepID=A0AAE3LLP1_9BACT|nr:outer membrane beta-barrel protein [Haoranjiania flava]MCU7692906.1 outer membrane beta-barrel protein [Haoranjiania flava]
MKTHFLTVIVLFLTTQLYAQTGRQVSGVVNNAEGTALPGATIKLLTAKDSLVVAADDQGRYHFLSVPVNQFSLLVTSIGYQQAKYSYRLPPGRLAVELSPVILKSDTTTLRDVTVSSITAVRMKEDTIEYNVAAYKVRKGAVIEDALKKMPGLEVSRDGSISVQGKQVSKVQLNGKDYMAGDVKSLTRNLPAELVQNVQVIDDHGDQARLTGIKTSDAQKVMNINIRKDKNHGYFALATAGGGGDMIPQSRGGRNNGRYAAYTNIFNFEGQRQITLSGDLNNTNTSLFDFSESGRKGPPDLFGDKQNGITTVRSLGFNYRDDWGKQLTVYGSYSVAENGVNTISLTIRDNLSGQSASTQTSNSNRNDRNLNHRAHFNIEFRPDTLNYFKLMPTFSYGNMRTNESVASRLQASNDSGALMSDYTRSLQARSSSINFGISALYNHRFRRRGRNMNILLNGCTVTSDRYENPVYNFMAGTANAPANQIINTSGRTDSAGVSLSYLEPVGKKSYFEFNYNFQNTSITADRLTDTLSATGEVNRASDLSNDYKFDFMINRFGVNYRLIEKKYNVTLGFAAQPALLQGSSSAMASTRKTSLNFSPVLRYVYNFSDLQAIAVNFSGESSSPSYYQLQPVTDFSNANYPVQGNPTLLPEYNNTLQLRYNKFGDGTGKTFFTTLSFTQTNHKIVVNTVTYPGNYIPDPKLAGTILTNYRNTSGFYNVSGNYVLSGAWAKRKYTWLLNGNISYNNNIAYLTDVLDSKGMNQAIRKNIAKILILAQGARFRADILDVIDADVSANYLISHSGNAIPDADLNKNFQTITLGTSGKLYFLKNWTLGYTYNKTIYKYFQGAANPNLFDTYIEFRFLKQNMAAIRFSVYDLFNENTGFSSAQTAHNIIQTNVKRLGRYFLLSFTFRLQKFAGKVPQEAPGMDNGG